MENCYCLSINDHRYSYMCKNFERCGLTIPKLFKGVKAKDWARHCCLFGHMAIIMMARNLQLPYVYIFEDDAFPRNDALEKIKYYVDHRPDDCGILCFGRNGHDGEVKDFDDYMMIMETPMGAHSYLVYQDCYNDVITSMEREKVADVALRAKNYPNKKPYWTKEFLFIQNNMDSLCMSKTMVNKRGRYFYPDPTNGNLLVTNKIPLNFG